MSNKKENVDLKTKSLKSSYSEYTDFIKNLAKIAESTQLNEIEFKENNLHIKIRKDKEAVVTTPSIPSTITSIPQTNNVAPQPAAPAPQTEIKLEEQDFSKHSGAVLSPMVGVAYMAPNPDAADFVSEGAKVKEGDTVMLIEAMKVFNSIKAHKNGTVTKILVSSNQTVEFNQPLIIIE